MNIYQKVIIHTAITFGWLACAAPVQADDWTGRVRIDGFASTAYQVTDEKTLFNGDKDRKGINEDGSFQGTRIGLNVTAKVADNLTLAALLLSSIEENNYNTRVDWGFATLDISNTLDLRFGKIKFPVGVVNEYVDVGYAYPWIRAPLVIYSEVPNGTQATREAFTGSTLAWSKSVGGGMRLSADVFGGEVNLENMNVKSLLGVTARVDWDDAVLFQVSTYQGNMVNTPMPAMEDKQHEATVIGLKVDWHNIVFYTENASVDMQDLPALSADPWYATIGYRIGKLLPHYTHQRFKQGDGDKQDIDTIGLRYDFMKNTALKIEASRIKTEGVGLFDSAPTDGSTNMYGIAIDFVF